jgi:hypothetical protein
MDMDILTKKVCSSPIGELLLLLIAKKRGELVKYGEFI